MNREKMLEIADIIEGRPHAKGHNVGQVIGQQMTGFNMGTWRSYYMGCGTAGCIGGWVTELEGAKPSEDDLDTVQRVFDISLGQAQYLCGPTDLGNWDNLTPSMAANAIRAMAHGCNAVDAWQNAVQAGEPG